jgi:hypothetical protein
MQQSLIDLVKEVTDKSFEEVSASSTISKLLYVYSKLYLNGCPPKLCGKCHKKYYNQLKINGMEKAELLEKAKNRTCKPFWKGNKYIPKIVCRHYSDQFITDEEAIMLLNKGLLNEKDFIKLPDGYKKIEEKIQKREEIKIEEKPIRKTYPKKAGRPKKNSPKKSS